MQTRAIEILDRHSVMTIATLRADGWPQATTVGYVNEGMQLFFLISRTSQKFKNIATDSRVSIAIASEPASKAEIQGLSVAARAFELRDEPYRSQMLVKLSARHPDYFDPAALDMAASALIHATPHIMAIVDFSKGLGHSEIITIGAEEIVEFTPNRPDNWGPNAKR